MSHPNGQAGPQNAGDADPMASKGESRLGPAVEPASRRPDAPRRGVGKVVAVSFLTGLLAGLLGLAPWLLTGARLPLQNLWATQVLPAQMPLALLPLNQYEATTLVALMTTGGAAAGLAVRLWSPARRRLAMWCAAGGVILVQVTAAIQAFTVLGEGLAPGPMSSLYLAGLQGGVVAAAVAGLVVLLLLAAKFRALAALGVGLVAVPFVSWVAAGVAYAAGVGNVPVLLTMLWHWLPAVLVGGSLAWCGLRPTVRALVWVVDLGLLWVVPAMFTAVQSVLGTRVLGGNLQEMAAMGKQVFAAALGSAGGAWPTILLALAIALPGAFVRFPPRKQGQAGRADDRV